MQQTAFYLAAAGGHVRHPTIEFHAHMTALAATRFDNRALSAKEAQKLAAYHSDEYTHLRIKSSRELRLDPPGLAHIAPGSQG